MQVLVVEDQPLLRVAMEGLLRARLGVIDLCFAGDVAQAFECLAHCRPNLVMADFSTGDVCIGRGFEDIVGAAGGAPVIALDRRAIGAHLLRARAGGAKAYVLKTDTPELIDAAIGLVLAGGEYFPDVAACAGEATAPDWTRGLSPRQADVLELLAQGKTNREISAQLGIALATVKLHVHAILRAAGVRNRTEAVLRAKPR